MDGMSDELSRLNEDLKDAIREFDQEFERFTSINATIPIFPRRLRNFKMGAELLSRIVNLGNLACFVTGLVCAVIGGNLLAVGVALVVGSLFSEGAFIGQLWTMSYQNQHAVSSRLWGDEVFTRLTRLKTRIIDMSERIDILQQGTGSAGSEGAEDQEPA
jgi:hypothetical protein